MKGHENVDKVKSWLKCFKCDDRPATHLNTLCFECSQQVRAHEKERARTFRQTWLAELTVKRALCTDNGWHPWTPQSCRDWFTSMWPGYTEQKGYEIDMYPLQVFLGITPTVPRHINLCPCTHAQGRAINQKFEELAEA